MTVPADQHGIEADALVVHGPRVLVVGKHDRRGDFHELGSVGPIRAIALRDAGSVNGPRRSGSVHWPHAEPMQRCTDENGDDA